MELKPCPFCGESNATVNSTVYQATGYDAYAVSCRTIGCAAVIYCLGFGQFPTANEAVKAWNTRHPAA